MNAHQGDLGRDGKVYVGNQDSSNPEDNPLCVEVQDTGIYECTSKLSGKFITFARTNDTWLLRICEMKAYNMPNIAARYASAYATSSFLNH